MAEETPVTPTVSINLCCYNGERYIRKALESIVGQTYKDWELIVINDGSRDDSELIIQEFVEQGYPVASYWQENKGLSFSRNRAVELSRGKYIALIDQDDTWMPQKLELQMKLFDSNPLVGLVYSDCFFVYPDGRKALGSKFFTFQRGHVFKEMLSDYFVVLSTVIVRKDVVAEFGGFPTYRISEEFALFLKIAQKYAVDFVDKPLVEFLYHEGNTSRNLEINLKELEEIYRYWSEGGDEEIRNICKRSMGKMHYGLSRRALFHLNDKAQARHYIKGSFQYGWKLKYYFFSVFCIFPMWFIQGVRKLLFSTFYR